MPDSLRILRLPNVVYRPLVAEIDAGLDLYCVYRPGTPSPLLEDFLSVVRSHGQQTPAHTDRA